MKKIVAMISVLLLGAVLYANPITPEKALQVASRVFASGPSTKAVDASSLQIVWDGEFEPATKAAQDPAFYVVSRPEGGFVMVAGNDNVQPVLAFSFENPFVVEGMPENVRAWMEQYKGYVRAAKTATVDIQAQWSMFEETKTVTPAVPITSGFTGAFITSHTNEWDQTNPANFYCPDVNSQMQTSVCGCVALATAEVMAWFGDNNPSLKALHPSGYTIPGYNYQDDDDINVGISSHPLTTDYSSSVWTSLKGLSEASSFYNQVKVYGEAYNYSTAETMAQLKGLLYHGAGSDNPATPGHRNTLTSLGDTLALLVYDIGTLVEAEYNEADNADAPAHQGTGAITSKVVSKVAPVFGYNNAARYVSKASYTNSQWQQLLKDQITLRPVIYTGQGNGGHAYVADGYATYNDGLVFHFNMGWGGSCNGYYDLEIQEAYNDSHYAILDFYPNASSSAPLPIIEYGNGGGFEEVSGYNSATLAFKIKKFYNWGTAAFSGTLYAGREDASGALVESIALAEENLGLTSGYTTYSASASFTNPVFGDRLVAYYKEASKSTLVPFRFEPLSAGLTAIPIFPAAAIKTKASYKVGDIFVFELTNHNYDYSTSAWTVTTPGGVTKNYTMNSDAVLLSEPGDYKITCTTDQETITTYITVTTP